MEKLSQMKNNCFKFLPTQPVASVAFQSPTLSPTRSPVSIIPKEARSKHRGGGMSFSVAKEPSSPKVSCMGQVQYSKKKKAQKLHKRVQQLEINKSEKKEEKILLWISKGSGGEGPKQSGKAFVVEEKAPSATVEAPSLGTMKKFASGRGTLCDVDFALAAER